MNTELTYEGASEAVSRVLMDADWEMESTVEVTRKILRALGIQKGGDKELEEID